MTAKKIKNKFIKEKLPKIVGTGINVLSVFNPKLAGKIALKLFCTPRGGKIQSFQKKFLATAKKEVLHLGDTAIQTYHWPGSGSKILLVHGWESNTWRWRKMLKVLRENKFDIYALDAPAHGDSGSKTFNAGLYADMMDVVCQRFQPQALVGHSIGAFASLLYCDKYKPTEIKKIVLLACPDKLTDLTLHFYKILNLSVSAQKGYESNFLDHFGKDISYYSASDFANRTNIPGVIIHDQDDDVNFYFEGQAIVKSWQNGKLHTTNGLGHSLQSQEVYQIVASELSDF